MAVTFAETTTTGRQLWSNDEQATPSVWGWYEQHMITWMGEICDAQLGAITAGSGYQDGTYQNVELRRKDWQVHTGGRHMLATVVIAGGAVSTVTITQKGNGFKTGDVLVIYNLAEVGGTGSGYEQPLESANAEVGFVHDTQTATYPTYMVAQKVGFDRDDSYNIGTMMYKPSSTSTTYWLNNYIFTESASNNGYGGWTYQINRTYNTWYEANGDGYRISVIYCTEPGNEFFLWTDDAYSPAFGWFKSNQNGDGPWPSKNVCSQWCMVIGTCWLGWPMMRQAYSTAYTGANEVGVNYPTDTGVLWGNGIRFGRAWIQGTMPSRLKAHGNFSMGYGHEYEDDDGNTFRRFGSNYHYVQIN